MQSALTGALCLLLLRPVRCPRCEQNFYQAAESCPHCGFTYTDAEAVFGHEPVSVSKLSDIAGILRMRDRDAVRKQQDFFEERFPQLFFGIYVKALDENVNLRQFGFWLLNQADFEDVDDERTNDCGILLTIDVTTRQLGMTFGYSLLPYLDEDSSFDILSHAHASLLEGKWADALSVIIQKTSMHLKKLSLQARKNPELLLHESGQRLLQLEDEESPELIDLQTQNAPQ